MGRVFVADGALWVSTLSGAPCLPGAAAIWRVTPGAPPGKIIDGLSRVADFDIARDGTVWVSRHASVPFLSGPSAIDRIAPNGTRASHLVGQVTQPTGIKVGPDGAICVSNRGAQPNVGEVSRIVP
jgi:sugar lactone lactonase YvrE